ncbi:hypothetical protein ARALYDRAFT_911377 [Arabidopsis lyrata subsp. lyrata]|uniref:AB hydrolase-1 domain-containing protein n=1 Tax=Arabidopsis lyrata subsp. lyrata TaxID=81972 RepID=D7LYR9_ARALL|nr:hypothetical protein ARALYDRAFT_911377 [Arabidopsis lyrata subsp. lyrata]
MSKRKWRAIMKSRLTMSFTVVEMLQVQGRVVYPRLRIFVRSSAFWTETVFSNLSNSNYRLFAVDLLGLGKSPKPADSLYTMREHVEMIEKSVLLFFSNLPYHQVQVPAIEAEPRQYVMRKVAPPRVWPPIAFGTSMACWYACTH